MTKLCPRGKAAAKRKFKVYPSAYANAYASKICAGKIKDPSGVKRKDFRGRKPSAMGGRVYKAAGGLMEATQRLRRQGKNFTVSISCVPLYIKAFVIGINNIDKNKDTLTAS